MKHLFRDALSKTHLALLAFLLVSAFSFYSCQDEAYTENEEPSTLRQQKTSGGISATSPIFKLVDLTGNYPVFDTEQDYKDWMEEYSLLTSDEVVDLDTVVQTHASYQTALSAFDDMTDDLNDNDDNYENGPKNPADSIACLNLQNQLLFNNTDISEIRNVKGDDVLHFSHQTSHPIEPFINREGIFKVDSEYRRIADGVLYTSTTRSDIIGDVNAFGTGVESEVIIWEGDDGVIEPRSTCEDIIDKKFSEEVEKDKFWCKNDRKAVFEYKAFKQKNKYKPEGIEITDYWLQFESKARAIRKGIPCFWYGYKTTQEINNYQFKGEFTVTHPTLADQVYPFDLVIPDRNISKKTVKDEELVVIHAPDNQTKYEACFEVERVDFSTKGVGNIWVVIDN